DKWLHAHRTVGNVEALSLGLAHGQRKKRGAVADVALRNRHAPVEDGFAPAFADVQIAGHDFAIAKPHNRNTACALGAAMKDAAEIGLAEKAAITREGEGVAGFDSRGRGGGTGLD